MSRYLSIEELQNTKVFIMAGDGPDANTVYGVNKCFIPIHGKVVLDYMLDQFYELGMKKIHLVGTEKEIKKNIRPNSNLNYLDVEGLVSTKISRIVDDFDFVGEEPALIVFGDTPLLKKRALIDFVSSCDLDEADFFHPLVPQEYISIFGNYFNRDYVHTRDIDFRVNCMSLAKPNKLDFRNIQNISDHRKMDSQDPDYGKKVKRKSFFMNALNAIGPDGLFFVVKLLLNSRLYRTKYYGLHKLLNKFCTLGDVNKYTGKLFGARAKGIILPYGETTLDIDAERDADIFRANFDELEGVVRREHEMIDFYNDNTRFIQQLAADDQLTDSVKSNIFYREARRHLQNPLLEILRKDYHSFRRVCQIYSKKGPKAKGYIRHR